MEIKEIKQMNKEQIKKQAKELIKALKESYKGIDEAEVKKRELAIIHFTIDLSYL